MLLWAAITIDGDYTDWGGTPPAQIHDVAIDNGEWIYKGESGDERTDLDNPAPYGDITEVRFTSDANFLYILIKFSNFSDINEVHVSLAVDTDLLPNDGDYNWIGDDGDTSLKWGFQFAERIYELHCGASNVPDIESWNGGSSKWEAPGTKGSDYDIAISNTNDCLEAKISWAQIGVSPPCFVRFSLVTFKNHFTGSGYWANDGDSTTDIGGTSDVIDVMGGTPGSSSNAWWRDVSDGTIDYCYLVRFTSAGASEICPDGFSLEWAGTAPSSGEAAISSGEYIWSDLSGDERTDATDSDLNYDMMELRVRAYEDLAGTEDYLLFSVKLSDIERYTGGTDFKPLIVLSIDTDQNSSDAGQTFFGDDSDTTLARSETYAERNIMVGLNGVWIIDDDSGSTWYRPDADAGRVTPYTVNWDTDTVEFAVPLTDVEGISLPATIRVCAGTACYNGDGDPDSIDKTLDISGSSDILDTVTPAVSFNTWDIEVSDGDIDASFDLKLQADGSVASNTPPSDTTLQYPVGNVTVPSTVTLSWDASSDSDGTVEGYLVQVDDNNTFSSPEVEEFVVGDTSLTVSLTSGVTYYWRVRPYDNCLVPSSSWATDDGAGNLGQFTTAVSPITVDGDPSDWGTTAPTNAHDVLVYSQDVGATTYYYWVYLGASGDCPADRKDSNADITEVRFTSDGTKLYGLIKFQDVSDVSKPHISIALDSDLNPADTGESWIGDDSGTTLKYGFQFAERIIDLHVTEASGTQAVEIYDPVNGTWYGDPSHYEIVIDDTNDCIEFSVEWQHLGLDPTNFLPGLIRVTVVSFLNNITWNNDGDSTQGFDTCDAVDLMGGFIGDTSSSWDRDLSDGVIEFYYTLHVSGTGVDACSPDGFALEWTGTAPASSNTAGFSSDEWIWKDATGDERTDLATSGYDIEEIRVKGIENYVGSNDYILISYKLDAIDSIYTPLVIMGFATGTVSADKMSWFADDSGAYLEDYAPGLDFQLMVGVDGPWMFACDGTSWYRPDDIYYTISPINDMIEIAIPLWRLGYTDFSDSKISDLKIYFALGGYAGDGSPDTIDKTANFPSACDIADLAVLNESTWAAVSDSKIASWFLIPFPGDGTVTLTGSAPNSLDEEEPTGNAYQDPVALLLKWTTTTPDPDSYDCPFWALAKIKDTDTSETFYAIREYGEIPNQTGSLLSVLVWNLTDDHTYQVLEVWIRDKTGCVCDYTPASWSFVKKPAPKKIDGVLDDWRSTSPSIPNTAIYDASFKEWGWLDEIGDHRTDATDPDSNYDIKEIRLYSDGTFIYGAIVMDDITDATLPWIGIAVGDDSTATQQTIADLDSDFYLDSRMAVISYDRTGAYDTAGNFLYGAAVSFINDTSNCIEFRFLWSDLGIADPSGKSIRITIVSACNSSGAPTDVTGSNVLDVCSDHGIYTWPDVVDSSDSLVETYFVLNFDSSGYISSASPAVAPSSVVVNANKSCPEFTYSKPSNATSYLLEVATDSEFSSIVYRVGLRSSADPVDFDLGNFGTDGLVLANAHYYWRILSRNAEGVPSEWTSGEMDVKGEKRVIDGDPSDWLAQAPQTPNTSKIEYGEWVWKDETGDERTDAAPPDTNFDLVELRITNDSDYLYILAKLAYVTNVGLPLLDIALDTDSTANTSDSGLNWLGDETTSSGSTLLGSSVQYSEINLEITYDGVYYYTDTGTSWQKATDAEVVISKENSCIEAKVSLSEIGITLPCPVILTAAIAERNGEILGDPKPNYGDYTIDFPTCDHLDTVTFTDFVQGVNTWDSELSDGDIDWYCYFELTANGVADNAPTVNLISPADGSTVKTLQPSFSWSYSDLDEAASGKDEVIGYLFYLSEDAGGENIVFKKYISGKASNSIDLSSEGVTLAGGRTYYWWVEAYDRALVKGSSSVAEFKTDYILTAQGGSYYLSGVEVTLPQGAISQTGILKVEKLNPADYIAEAKASGFDEDKFLKAPVYRIRILDQTETFELSPETVSVKIYYSEPFGSMVSEQRLIIWKLSGDKWEPVISSTAEPRENSVSATLKGLSIFTVMENPTPDISDLSQVIVFPNPFYPDRGSLKFDMLPQGAVVEIYDLSGRRIWKSDPADSYGRIEWKAEGVASGFYYAVIKSGNMKRKFRVVIIR